MALNPSYMIAPSLEEYFVDKATGAPLRGGIVTFYKDQARTELKAIYGLSGSPPNYSYVQLPNPLTLTGVGTFSDGNNNDILPYYYPYDDNGNVELYFITVYDSDGNFQWSREAWPNFSASSAAENFRNYIPNGQFLIHADVPATDNTVAGQITQPITTLAQGGWTFERPSGSTATDIVTFAPFNGYVANPDASPKYALQVVNQVPASGDAYKDVRIKFTDVNKFASLTQIYTLALFGQSNTGSSLVINVILIKNYGTGGSSTTETTIGTMTLPASYGIAQLQFTFGTNGSETIGSEGDDYLQIAFRLPTSSVFSLSFTDAILALGALGITGFPQTPDAQFKYEAIAGWMATPAYDGSDLYLPLQLTPSGIVFSHADIGKVFGGMYDTPNVGELLCDGSQYETIAYSSDGIPYSRLFKVLLANSIGNMCPLFGTGRAFMTTIASGVAGGFFSYNNTGGSVTNAADGTNPTSFTFRTIYNGNAGAIASQGFSLGGNVMYVRCNVYGTMNVNTNGGTSGFPVSIIQNSPNSRFLCAITTVPAAGLAGLYFNIGQGSAQFYIWFTVDGSGSDPSPGGTGFKVALVGTMTSTDVANAILSIFNGGQTTFIGVTTVLIPAGCYFTINTPAASYYVWYTLDGAGTDPKPGGIGIKVAALSTFTIAQLRAATVLAMNSKYFAVPDLRGLFLRGVDGGAGVDPDSYLRFSPTPFNPNDAVGTVQFDTYGEHLHNNTLNGVTALLQLATGTGSSGSGSDVNAVTPNLTNAYAGSKETRAINAYVNYFIKY